MDVGWLQPDGKGRRDEILSHEPNAHNNVRAWIKVKINTAPDPLRHFWYAIKMLFVERPLFYTQFLDRL